MSSGPTTWVMAVGLVEDVTVDEAALVVENHHTAHLGDRTVALFEDFVVEAFVAFLDIGSLLDELGEISLFAFPGLGHLIFLVHLAVHVGALVEFHEHHGGLLLGERLLFAVESGVDGL